MSSANWTHPLGKFICDEEGAIYPSSAFLMSTVVIAIPLGFMFIAILDSLCEGGRQANLIIGFF